MCVRCVGYIVYNVAAAAILFLFLFVLSSFHSFQSMWTKFFRNQVSEQSTSALTPKSIEMDFDQIPFSLFQIKNLCVFWGQNEFIKIKIASNNNGMKKR